MNFLKSKILLLNKIIIVIIMIGIVIFDFYISKKVYTFYNSHYIMELNGEFYCVKNRYYNAKLLTGLIDVDGDLYYFGDDFVMIRNKEVEIEGKIYFFGEDGKIVNYY